jgi:preprotein translocase subunit SecB
MTNRINYPFALVNAFFVCLDFQRQGEVPANLTLGIGIEIKVVTEKYPDQLQINLRISSQDKDPLKLSMELITLFKYTGTSPDQDKEKFIDFLNDRGFIMVWPYLNQMLKFITSQMGMQPLNLNFPPDFYVDLDLFKSAQPQE